MALANIGKSLDRFVKKETMTEAQKAEILGRIKSTTNLDDVKDCSLIVEAASENFEIKKQIFEKLDQITSVRCDPFVKHFVDLDHKDRRDDQTPGQGHRNAFFQSGSADETG